MVWQNRIQALTLILQVSPIQTKKTNKTIYHVKCSIEIKCEMKFQIIKRPMMIMRVGKLIMEWWEMTLTTIWSTKVSVLLAKKVNWIRSMNRTSHFRTWKVRNWSKNSCRSLKTLSPKRKSISVNSRIFNKSL